MKSEGFAAHALGSDQRRHRRVLHSDTVQCISGGGTIFGQCVDLSRSGMQVTVRGSDPQDSVRSVAFTLPRSHRTIDVPCRLVWVEGSEADPDQKTLGIEFTANAEAQLVLIEGYIQETLGGCGTAPGGEMRRLPRASCKIDSVEVDRPSVRVRSIDNVSLDGLLIHFDGELHPGQLVELAFHLPGEKRKLTVAGTVTYVIPRVPPQGSSAGVRLCSMKQVDRSRLMSFVVARSVESAIRNLHSSFDSSAMDARYIVSDRDSLVRLLESLHDSQAVLNVLLDDPAVMLQCRVASVEGELGLFGLEGGATPTRNEPARPSTAYCSFFVRGGSYYFRSEIQGRSVEAMKCRIPERMFRSEKRSYQRKSLSDNSGILLELDGDRPGAALCPAELLDISWRGFLCQVQEKSPGVRQLQAGKAIRYRVSEGLGLDQCGMIRHIKRCRADDGTPVLRVGIEAGIRTEQVRTTRYSPDQWARENRSSPIPARTRSSFVRSLPAAYHNHQGKRIAALLDGVRLGERAPVVIIPPAFGRKKEATSALSATLLHNFAHYGHNVVTVRYDGIDRPGESHSHDCSPQRGYEMLNSRLIQGLEDLRTTIDWTLNNPHFTPEKIFLVTSSMSALDARRLLASSGGDAVSAWVSLLGVPAAQPAYGNLLGGIDIIGNHKMGVPNGIGGILGHLVDLDQLARDLVAYRYAFVTDARADMARIRQPVLWIYGTHDCWLEPGDVRDIMGVAGGGAREVVEIPTGHNLRTSQEAIAAFKLIAGYLYRQAFSEEIVPVEPDREELLRVIACERERVSADGLSMRSYWQGYLSGSEENGWGYDFYKNFPEFRDFLAEECALARADSGDRIADLGCGTGLLLETLLEGLARQEREIEDLQIVAVDLVQEALDKARAKCEALTGAHRSLSDVQMRYLRMDLNPNRLIPVQRYLQDPRCGYDSLRNKVAGLRNATIDLMIEKDCPALREAMCGEPLGEASRSALSSILYDGHLQAVLDFNRAARFLRRNLNGEDLVPGTDSEASGTLPESAYGRVNSRHLKLQALDFADSDLSLALPFGTGAFTTIVASLFISYLRNPELLFPELYRILAPGGKLIVSALRPDSDLSSMYTRFVGKMKRFELEETRFGTRDENLKAARAMLNEAAGLMCLEEDGVFAFHSEEELLGMFQSAGFCDLQVRHSLGNPPQAIIVAGARR